MAAATDPPAADHVRTESRAGMWAWLGLVAVIALNLWANLHWLRANVVLVGRDATGHLERTVRAAEMLANPSLRTPFELLTLHDYRPPLLYIATQPFYALFGRTMDSAQLTNVFFQATILLLTFLLAKRLAGPWVALMAALLTGFFPMFSALARLFYMENLLTTLLLLNLLALLAGQGWQRRGWSLLWGLTLGLSLLVKWTAPIYLVLPTLYLLWRAELWSLQRRALSRLWLDWRRGAAALAAAFLFVAFWYLPNRGVLDEFLLGRALPLLWLALFAVAFYALSLLWGQSGAPEMGPLRHFWAGLLLGAAVASLWYFPQIDFLNRLVDVAFGTDRGNQESVNLLRLSNYTRYLRYWVTDHMGLLPTLVILPTAAWGWWRRLRGRTTREGFVVLWLVPASTYLFLMFLAQSNPRNLVPVAPVMAILLADALATYPRRWAIGLGVLWLATLALQWTIYTFDGMASFYRQAPVLWVRGDYHTWPSVGQTDPGYWIQPDVLATMGNPEGEAASFGVLVDSWEVHRGSFRYLIANQGFNIELMTLTEPEGRGWSDMLANQWILVKDGDNSGVREPGLSVVKRILAGDPLFHLLYHEVQRYPLPNGETLFLYRRDTGPAHPYDFPVVLIETAGIAEALNRWWSPGATLYVGNGDTATWVGIHDLRADRIRMPRNDGETPATLLDGVEGLLFAITRYDTPEVQDYLDATAHYVTEVGDGEFRLLLYVRPTRPPEPVTVDAAWEQVQVTDLATYREMAAGEVLPVMMEFAGLVDGSRKVSLRLVGPDGAVAAQRDLTVLEQGEAYLLAPPETPPGRYTLGALLYDPATLAPIPDEQGRELAPLVELTITE